MYQRNILRFDNNRQARFMGLVRILMVSLFFTMAIGCNNERQLPIEEAQLIKILCDIHIAESAIKVVSGTIKDTAATKVYNQIYQIHDVTAADVDTCLYYIKRDPQKMEKVYAKVTDALKEMKISGEQ